MSQLTFFRSPRQSPFQHLFQLQRTMDTLFDDLYQSGGQSEASLSTFQPRSEWSEDESAYHLKFDLPGLTKEQVKIELHEGVLTVSGERKEERVQNEKTRHVSEIAYGHFMRSFKLPQSIDQEKVEARFENGVLALDLPKSASAKPRQITLK